MTRKVPDVTRPTRILVVVPSISRLGGGVSEVVRLVTLGLIGTQGIDLHVATINDQYFDEDIKSWAGGIVTRFRAYGPRNFGFSPALLLAIFRRQPDVIHIHGLWMFQCAAVLLWALVTGRRYVVTPHGMLEEWIRRRSPVMKFIVSRLYQNWFLRKASCFQVLTYKEIGDIRNAIGDRPVRVIPNYVDIVPRVDRLPAPPWWEEAYEGRDIYLYLGRIHDKKGCLELCAAWNDLCSTDKNFSSRSMLVFCGWIDSLSEFEAKITALHQRFENVIFTGPQYAAAKDQSLAQATFLVLPSKSEGLPVVVLEAWANAIPVLMTAECNLAIGFRSGAAVEMRPDVASIASGLSACSHMMSSERRSMGEAGLQLVRRDYSRQVVIGQLLKMYRETAAR